MVGQFVGQVVPLQLDVNEVHGERELVAVQHSVAVDVRQFPNLAERRVRQPRPDHLRLGGGARHLPVDRVETLECLVVLVPVLRHDPLALAAPLVDALPDADPERAVVDALEGAALHPRVGRAVVVLERNHLHETRDVLGEHPVDVLDQARLEDVELGEVLVGERLLHVLHLREVSKRDLVLLQV